MNSSRLAACSLRNEQAVRAHEPGQPDGLNGPGIESRWGGEVFRTCPDRPWGPTSLLYDGYRVFPGGKERPGRDVDPLLLLVPWS